MARPQCTCASHFLLLWSNTNRPKYSEGSLSSGQSVSCSPARPAYCFYRNGPSINILLTNSCSHAPRSLRAVCLSTVYPIYDMVRLLFLFFRSIDERPMHYVHLLQKQAGSPRFSKPKSGKRCIADVTHCVLTLRVIWGVVRHKCIV